MGLYRAHTARVLPEPGILKLNAYVTDDADTDFSALTVTQRNGTTAGKLSTGTLAVGDGGTMEIGFVLDSLVASLGEGIFDSSDPVGTSGTSGYQIKPCYLALALSKDQGSATTEGATVGGLLDLNTFAQLTAGVDAVTGVKATAALAFTGVGVDTQTFTVNNKTYTLVTTLVAKATAALAFTGVAVNTQTATVNDVTYTFYDILLDVPGAILIGADQTETCNNLVSAVMGTAGAGTLYGTGTTAPTGVNSAVRASTTVTFTATANGTAANSFASTETCANASFTNGATFTGGVSDTADTILIGADQTATCNNIVSAIMGTAGAGSTYGTGTAAPTGVDTAVRASTTVTFTATATGVAANSFASTETCTNASFGGATFSGGVDAVTAVARVVRQATALTLDAGGGNAISSSLITALANTSDTMDSGIDLVSFAWTRPNGSTGTSVYTYTTGDTVQTLMTFIEVTCFNSLVTVTLASGKLVITNNVAGSTSLNATALVATEDDIGPGTYISAIRLDTVSSAGVTLTHTTLKSMAGGPWLTGAAAALPTEILLPFTPTLQVGESLELVLVVTLMEGDTAEICVHAVPEAHLLGFDLEGRI